jgi:uncharacterized membrane protein YqhA
VGSRLLASSRYVITIAALGTFVSGTVMLIFGTLAVIDIAIDAFVAFNLSTHAVEELAVEFIKLTDVFLLGTVLYIVSLGLYELFVDPTLPLPQWLIIKDLEHLKEKLIGVIIVLLGVTFLGEIVSWDGESDILRLGLAIALVVAALSFVLTTLSRHHERTEPAHPAEPPAGPEVPPPADSSNPPVSPS